jgi:hypothetical protein
MPAGSHAPSLCDSPRTELPASAPSTLFSARMKSCSVVTYSESVLLRMPWSTVRPGSGEDRPMPVPDPKGKGAAKHRRGMKRFPVPGSFERSVFRALEWIAIDQSVAQGVPFANPLVFHPRDLCERLCWRATLPQFQAIEKGLSALTWIRLRQSRGSESFGLLKSAFPATPSRRKTQAICPNFVVYFDDRFVHSVNAGRIIPVNWGLWVALEDPVARRLLEVLEDERFRLEERGPWVLSLDFLASRLPMGVEVGADERRRWLARAHEELIRQEYLEDAEMLPRGRYRYHPGPTCLAMQMGLAQHHEQVKLNRIRSGWPLGTAAKPSSSGILHNIPRACSSL